MRGFYRGFRGAAFCIMLAAASASHLSAEQPPVKVAKIRIVIDSVTYEWASGGAENSGGAPIEPRLSCAAVASFLGFQPGSEASLEALQRMCREAEIRLAKSGLVYSVSVQPLPARKNPAERTVLVSVESGFFWRFGGGNAWGLVGRDAIGGERALAMVVAGWNLNGLRYERHGIGGTGLFAGSGAFWHGPGPSDAANPSTGIPAENLDFETSFRSGWDISPDLALGADVVFAGLFEEPSSDWSIQPFLEWKKYMIPLRSEDYGTESDAGLKARAYAFPGTKEFKGEASVFYHDPVSARSAYALRLSVGSATAGTGFDLLHTEDRSVRAGYESLFARHFALASAEYRFRILSIRPAAGITCDVQLFSFADTAVFAQAGAGERTDAAAIASSGAYGSEALGLGLRLLFDNPVFAYFTFTYGVNRRGEGSFRMCGTAGF